jgi:hypothetical protein
MFRTIPLLRSSPRGLGPWLASAAVALAAIGCADDGSSDASAEQELQGAATSDPFEVWIVDQSDSDHEGAFGGMLYVFDGVDLMGDRPGSTVPRDRVDLAGATAEACRAETGANPVRPHMLLFNEEGTHGILSFVASGHVVILDADTREPVACFRTSPGAGGSQQAHAAYPSPDGSYIIVANQNGKLLERIDADFRSGTFSYNADATLDLANGTTPAGLPRESGELRPDNAPICPVIDGESRYVWVTLRGGGLFVVDGRETPMRIVGEYDRGAVKGNGCGGVEAGGSLYLNSGGSPINLQGEEHPFLHLHGFDVYRFPLDGYGDEAGPNLPAPELVFEAEGERDSHGMAAVNGETALWVMDRHQDVAEVFEVGTGVHLNTVALAGPLSDNPAPDLVDVAPSGDRLFVSLRGSVPLTGDPHNATGSTPGLGIVEVRDGGRTGELIGVVPFSNEPAHENIADPHAVRVRPLP